MKIGKIIYKYSQAWINLYTYDDKYIGTLYCSNPEIVEAIKMEDPNRMRFINDKNGKSKKNKV